MPGTVIGGELVVVVGELASLSVCLLKNAVVFWPLMGHHMVKKKKKEHASVLRLNDQADMIQRVPRRLGAPFGTCRRLSAYRRANGQPIGHGRFRLNLNEGVSVRLLPWPTRCGRPAGVDLAAQGPPVIALYQSTSINRRRGKKKAKKKALFFFFTRLWSVKRKPLSWRWMEHGRRLTKFHIVVVAPAPSPCVAQNLDGNRANMYISHMHYNRLNNAVCATTTQG